MNPKLLYAITIGVLTSCGSGQTMVRVGPFGKVLADPSEQLEEIEEAKEEIEYHLLMPGSYHGEDVDTTFQKGWTGLFFNADSVYLDSIDLTFQPAFDAMLDNEGDSSGISIVSQPAGADYYLHGLRPGPCTSIEKNVGSIFPGDSHSFEFHGRKFRLVATAKNQGQDGDYSQVVDYQLALSVVLNAEELTNVLATTYQFDDGEINVLFIGDIDSDGWPDLIVDTSPKYSYSEITLYLSRPAQGKDIVKPVARFRATGC